MSRFRRVQNKLLTIYEVVVKFAFFVARGYCLVRD